MQRLPQHSQKAKIEMAEVVGAIAAVAQLLDGAIEIFKAFKQAYDRQHSHADFLEKCRLKLVAIREVIRMVENEKGLATSQVITVLKRLNGPQKDLSEWLKKVDRGDKKAVQRFVYQLVHGKADRKRLDDILADLNHATNDLNTAINVTSAGRTYRMERRATNSSSTSVTSRRSNGITVDGPVNPVLSKATGQRPLHRQRTEASDDFNDSGISADGSDAGSEPPSSLNEQSEMEWTVSNNVADHGAMMVNARIGGDTYQQTLTKLTINNNKADNGGVMINYPNEKDDLTFLFELQMKREEHTWHLQNGNRRL